MEAGSISGVIREFFESQGQKAFPYRVELTDAGGPLLSGGGPTAYNDYNGTVFNSQTRTQTPLSQTEAQNHLQAYGGPDSIDWLVDAVDFVATSASSASWHFDDKGTELAARKLPTDPPDVKMAPDLLVQLFEEPNPHMIWEDLIELTIIDWMFVGNAYWVKWHMNASMQPLALYRMAPQYVRIIPGQFGPEAYLYKLPGMPEPVQFTPDQVVHFKRPNPHSAYYGMGVVKGSARALDMEVGLTKTTAAYYENGTNPSGVVSSERRVPRDVFNKLKRQLSSFYSGGANAGKLMVLEAGLTYQPISPNANDAAFLPMSKASRDRTLAALNMNKSLIGVWDQGDNPQIGQWQTLFDQKTMVPLCNKLSKLISRSVTKPGWGLDFVIDYAETQQPDDVLNRANVLAKMPGVKVHELRAAAGLAPSTGDKDIDETVLNLPGPNLNDNGQGGFADQNLPGEPGRPPKMENTQPISGKPAPAGPASGTRSRVAKTGTKSLEDMVLDLELALLEHKAMKPADHVHIGKLAGDHVKAPAEDFLHAKRSMELSLLAAQTHGDLKDASHALERGILDALDTKAGETVYQKVKNAAAWAQFKERLTTILDTAAQQAMSLASVHHAQQGMKPSDTDYQKASDALLARKEGGVDSILNTLKNTLLGKVLSKQRSGVPQSEIQNAVQETIAEWQDGRSQAVASDIGNVSYNHSTLDIAEANGAVEVLVSDGDEVDEPCIEANGSTWPIEQARENMQEHPRCQRAFVPILPVGS